MKSFIKKIRKEDVLFLFALASFAIVAFIRFFDHKLQMHRAPFAIMQDYKFSLCAIACYFLLMFIFFLNCMFYCEKSKKKILYYLIAFFSVFSFPMFLHSNYFGTMDIYAWLLTFICGILFVNRKLEWLSVCASLVLTFVSPMSLFSCECMIVVLFLYKFFLDKSIKYFILAFLNVLTGSLGFILNYLKVGFHSDAQHAISFEQFGMIVVLMIPYMFFVIPFFSGLIRRVSWKRKLGWGLLLLGCIPSIAVNMYIEDYSRLLFQVFTYFSFIVISLFSGNDNDTMEQLEITRKQIKEWVPIPVVIIAYPLIIMTLWVSGPLDLFIETFVGN